MLKEKRKKKQLHILSIYNDDDTIIVRVSNKKSNGWGETEEGADTPGFQRYDWEFFDGDSPYFEDYMFFHGRWYKTRLPFSEKELEMARNCQ